MTPIKINNREYFYKEANDGCYTMFFIKQEITIIDTKRKYIIFGEKIKEKIDKIEYKHVFSFQTRLSSQFNKEALKNSEKEYYEKKLENELLVSGKFSI